MKNMDKAPKAIAMYLPQFHNVKENNMWWGEGFTDWRAMECAKPLFDGHKQPKCPLNNYKYNLMDKKTMQWQADLMHKYHVYGLCFYHYWFKEGKKILEKPAENLLKWKDIDMPFCFCWANESWVRSWSKLNNQNVWASQFETNYKGEDKKGVLLEQDYGCELDWIQHFNYLKTFFADQRYIKKDNKPVFIIYRPLDIVCINDMYELWNKLAIEEGYDGIYMIGACRNEECPKLFDAKFIQEPMSTIKKYYNDRFNNVNRTEVARYVSYDDIWNTLLKNEPVGTKTYYGGFTGYDDSPRRGNAGTVIFNSTPEKFKVYLADLYAKNAVAGSEFVFINAWNEWGEGTYLEPDTEYGYEYLEAFSYAENHYMEEMYKYEQSDSDSEEDRLLVRLQKEKTRYITEKCLLDKWLYLERNRCSITKYFENNNVNHIAIYGYGIFGKQLLSEIENQDKIMCDYIIDKNSEGLNMKNVYSPDDTLPKTEMIVVTTIHIYNEIYNLLKNRTNCKIVSLKEILDGVSLEL